MLFRSLVGGATMPPSKAAQQRKGKTLIAKGHLRDSYVYQLTSEGVEVGSALIYAAIHHFGGETGRGHRTKLPARPVLGLDDAGQAQVGEILLNELRRSQGGGGLFA
mgnify:CR=1 FL=1